MPSVPDSAVSPPGEAPTPPPESEQLTVAEGRRGLVLLAAAVTLASLAAPIAITGIWDPHEIRVAELSRRIACSLLGAADLVLEGADNGVPTLAELGRGQLPFQSVALGFRLFGLHEWAGRLPLVLWGLAGVAATVVLVGRLSDRVTAALAALVLSTMPLYFVHARTILGDIVTMASVAIAIAGLGLATFDQRQVSGKATALKLRTAWLGLGLLGVGAGYAARGLLLGVAIPTLGVGLSWAALAGTGRAGRDWFGRVCGGAVLAAGMVACGAGLFALRRAAEAPDEFSMLVGAAVAQQRDLRTFEFVARNLGHGLFPWSALLPVALGYTLLAPPGRVSPAQARELGLRVLLLVVSAVALAVHGVMAPTVGQVPFVAVFALAGIIAIGLRAVDRRAVGVRAVALAVAALAIVLAYDFKQFPEKGLVAFAVADAKFPDSFKNTGTRLLVGGTLLFVVGFFFSIQEWPAARAPRFRVEDYLEWPRALRRLWGGNLLFGVLVLEATLLGLFLLNWLSQVVLHLRQFERLGSLARTVVLSGWLVVPAIVLLIPAAALLARDVTRWVYARTRARRGLGAALAVVICGVISSLWYYPALAAQISPKQVFESYQRLAGSDDRLGTVGVGSASANYYTGGNVPTFGSAVAGFEWLVKGSERRWLMVRQQDLAQLNSLHRRRTASRAVGAEEHEDGSARDGARNLPVLDARSSEILLVSNRLLPGEQSQNPFDAWVLSKRPSPAVPVDGNLAGQLEVLGWEVTTPEGAVVHTIAPGQSYDFRIYYEVVKNISGAWETFLHIDGHRRRFNGDHKTLEGKYPLHLWRPGDFIADIHRIRLQPNFTPGDYRVFFGLFIGGRRLDVKRGNHDDNRLRAGTITVR